MPLTQLKNPRGRRRLLFAASCVVNDNVLALDILRGAWIVTVDKDGDQIATRREAAKRLWVTIGDRLIVSAWDVATNEVALVEIERVDQDGHRMDAVVRLGGVGVETKRVHVQPCKIGVAR
jgi:hypothetical protein